MAALHYTDGQHTAFAEYFLSAGVDMNKLANICLSNVPLAQWFYCFLGGRCVDNMEHRQALSVAGIGWGPLTQALKADVRAEQWLINEAEKWATMSGVVGNTKLATVPTGMRQVFGLALFEAMMTHNDQAQQCVLRGETSYASDELQAQRLLGTILRRDILRTKQQEDMLAGRTPTVEGSYVATNKQILADSYAECSSLLAKYCASHARLPDEVLLVNLANDDEPVGELPPQ